MPKLKNTEKQKYEEEIENLKGEVLNLMKRGRDLEDLLGSAAPIAWAVNDGEKNLVDAWKWEIKAKEALG